MPEQIGKKVTIATLVANMIVLRLLISGGPLITTFEPESVKSLNSQETDPVISEVTDGSGLDICSESKVEEFIKLPNVVKSSRLDSEDLGNCSCSSAGDEWNVIEECKLLACDTKEFNSPPNILFERCEDLELANGSKACLHTVESDNCTTKEGPHKKYELPLCSLNQKTTEEFEQSRVKLGAIKKDNVLLGIDVVFLKNNCWSFIYLIVMLLDEMINLNLIGPTLDIWIGAVTTMVLGIEIPRHFESAFPWMSIPVLMYLTAYCLMVLSVVFKCTSRRELLSDVAVGAAFTCTTFGIIFSVIVGTLPSGLEYVCVCIGVVIVLAIICFVHRVFLDAAIQRWMGELVE